MSTPLQKAATTVQNHMAWQLFVECLPIDEIEPLQQLFTAVVANFSEEALPLAPHQQLIYYATCQHVWKRHVQPPLDAALLELSAGKRLSQMTAEEKKAYNTKVQEAVIKKITQLLYQFSHTYNLDLDVPNVDIDDLARQGIHLFKQFHGHYRTFEKTRTSNTQSLTEQVKAFTFFFQAASSAITSSLSTQAINIFTAVVSHIRNTKVAALVADKGIEVAGDALTLFGGITKRIQTLANVMLTPRPPAPPAPEPEPVIEAPAVKAEEEADSKAGPQFVHTFDKARLPATKAVSPNPPAAKLRPAPVPAPLPHPLLPLIRSLYKVIRQVQALPKAAEPTEKAPAAFDASKLFQEETLSRYAGSLGVKEDALLALFNKLKEQAPKAEERALLGKGVMHFATRLLEKLVPQSE